MVVSDPALAAELAERAIACGAIRWSLTEPFTWASGYRMPLYNDNRLLISDFATRRRIADGLAALAGQLDAPPSIVAGTATAGIPAATSLADRLQTRLVYVRPQAKEHGLGKQIEGGAVAGESVLLVEDLVSTGQSSLAALTALRQAGGLVDDCVAVFSYGLLAAKEGFAAAHCRLQTLLDFETLLQVASRSGALQDGERQALQSWRDDPFAWGAARGFARRTSP